MARLPCLHLRNECLYVVKRRPEVDVHELLPLAQRSVDEFGVEANTRVVDQDIDATEFLLHVVA